MGAVCPPRAASAATGARVVHNTTRDSSHTRKPRKAPGWLLFREANTLLGICLVFKSVRGQLPQ